MLKRARQHESTKKIDSIIKETKSANDDQNVKDDPPTNEVKTKRKQYEELNQPKN